MTTSEGEPGRHGLALYVLTPVAVAVAVIAGTLAVFAGGTDATTTVVAPLELAAVSPAIAEHYHSATELEDVYQQGCCPGAFSIDTTTIQPGATATLGFELSMHAGMDGWHDIAVHVPARAGSTDHVLDLDVTGDFTNT